MGPRYFTHSESFGGGTAFIKIIAPDRGYIYLKDGTYKPWVNEQGGLIFALDAVIHGVWKEITEEEAKALLKPKPKPKVGQRWRYSDFEASDDYLLVNVGAPGFVLVCLKSGIRWRDPVQNIGDVFGPYFPERFTLIG